MHVSHRILAVDVGNTRAKFGYFEAVHTSLPRASDIIAQVITPDVRLADAMQVWWSSVADRPPEISIIAGSNPEVRDDLVADWPFEQCPVVISGFQQIPVHVDVDYPNRVGIDRLLNVYASQQMQTCRTAVIAVDSGTATTVDLLTSDGTFRGGSILPGLRLSAHAMHDYTARLPLLNVDEEPAELPELPGRNTEDAMKAGLYFGQLGAVKELIARLTDAAYSRFQQQSPPAVVISGGGGRQLVRYIPGATFVDSLALHGLAVLASSR
ncbi:MAG: type III pantothenate kinase [Planctomycetota bacterium]